MGSQVMGRENRYQRSWPSVSTGRTWHELRVLFEFHKSIAATGSGGMSVVSGGIAEALVSTALGIFVAIPAVVAFNHFSGKIENSHVEMNRASSQLVNRLFKIPGVKLTEIEESEVAHASR